MSVYQVKLKSIKCLSVHLSDVLCNVVTVLHNVACTDLRDILFAIVPAGNQVPTALSGPDS